jgi:hypothetical protein
MPRIFFAGTEIKMLTLPYGMEMLFIGYSIIQLHLRKSTVNRCSYDTSLGREVNDIDARLDKRP